MKLLQLLNRGLFLFLLGILVASCHHPSWKHEKIILQESNNFIYSPDDFKVINDSECVFISDRHVLYKYNLRNGELLNYRMIDSVEFRQLLESKMKYLPKRDYKFIWSEKEAKKNHEKLYYFDGYDFDGRYYYIWSYLLTPYMGEYKGMKAYWLGKSCMLLQMDTSFVIKKSYYITSYFKQINPGFSYFFKVWKNRIYAMNFVVLGKKEIDQNYPLFSYITFSPDTDFINREPHFIKGIYFAPNAAITFNYILREQGDFKNFGGHLYASGGSNIWKLDGTPEKILQIDTAYRIESFDILSPTHINYISKVRYPPRLKDYRIVSFINGDTISKHVKYDIDSKIGEYFVSKNNFYFLVGDTAHFYIDHYELDK